jgi:transposase
MAYSREITNEEIAEIVFRYVRGESIRSIAARLGRAHTTVSRLLRQPDVAAIVAEERRKASAIEAEREQAVARERARKNSLERSRRNREQKAARRAPELSRKPGRAASSELSYREWLRLERELPPTESAMCVQYVGAQTEGSFGFNVLDPDEIAYAADNLISEGIGSEETRQELIAVIRRAKPGQTLPLRVEREATPLSRHRVVRSRPRSSAASPSSSGSA